MGICIYIYTFEDNIELTHVRWRTDRSEGEFYQATDQLSYGDSWGRTSWRHWEVHPWGVYRVYRVPKAIIQRRWNNPPLSSMMFPAKKTSQFIGGFPASHVLPEGMTSVWYCLSIPEKTMPLDFHCSIGVSIPKLTSVSAFISISPSHVATKNSVLSRGLDLPGNNLIQRFGRPIGCRNPIASPPPPSSSSKKNIIHHPSSIIIIIILLLIIIIIIIILIVIVIVIVIVTIIIMMNQSLLSLA